MFQLRCTDTPDTGLVLNEDGFPFERRTAPQRRELRDALDGAKLRTGRFDRVEVVTTGGEVVWTDEGDSPVRRFVRRTLTTLRLRLRFQPRRHDRLVGWNR